MLPRGGQKDIAAVACRCPGAGPPVVCYEVLQREVYSGPTLNLVVEVVIHAVVAIVVVNVHSCSSRRHRKGDDVVVVVVVVVKK